MEKAEKSLRALLDSEKRENIEIAVRMSASLPIAYQWLHQYAKAKLKLLGFPKYKRWYDLWVACRKFSPRDCAIIFSEFDDYIWEQVEISFTLSELNQNVANELHYHRSLEEESPYLIAKGDF